MPGSPLLWLAALTALLWILIFADTALGSRQLRFVRDLPPLDPQVAPPVTVVIAARNEQDKIEQALRSVLAQRYPRLEVLVVDDRSTDATGAILDRMALGSELEVVHLDQLPPGWLGKNHALQRGADRARGEWILFTDADVVFEPLALSRTVGYAMRDGIDHLAAAPGLTMPSTVLDAFAGTFSLLFSRFARPWKARDPRSRRHIGIGAFNLIRADAYRATGGHAPIAMRPDDDLKLGKRVKDAGLRQELVFGAGAITVEWYGTVREAIVGLEKNAFAGLEYSVPRTLAACLTLLTFDVWPFAAVFLTDGPTRLLYLLAVATALTLYLASTRGSGVRPATALTYPLAVLLFIYIILRSATLALHRGGIRWRDTLYPLDELRRNRV